MSQRRRTVSAATDGPSRRPRAADHPGTALIHVSSTSFVRADRLMFGAERTVHPYEADGRSFRDAGRGRVDQYYADKRQYSITIEALVSEGYVGSGCKTCSEGPFRP